LLLNKTQGINAGNLLSDPIVNEKTMVKPHGGYHRFSQDHMSKANIMKAVKLLRTSGFNKTSCTKLYHALATGGSSDE
jgi:hypothetical protein